MNSSSTSHQYDAAGRDAHVQLIVKLCDAIKTFVTVIEPQAELERGTVLEPAPNDDDEPQASRDQLWSDDLIGLQGILLEYGLRSPQVAKLRKSWGFPPPLTNGRRLLFSRSEVEKWARSQPNRQNLAIVLRSRRREQSPRVSPP
jgi:hypothetical protein